MKYFSIKELCYSSAAVANKIDNSPTPEVEKHLTELIENILDPLREAWGSGIKVTSGYRSPALNTKIKGSKTSAHCYGYAADLVPSNGKIEEFKKFVFKWLNDNNIQFDQEINEYSGSSSWQHIGYKNGKGEQRKQHMLYKNGKYSFTA